MTKETLVIPFEELPKPDHELAEEVVQELYSLDRRREYLLELLEEIKNRNENDSSLPAYLPSPPYVR